jgi:hypothetical protein
MDDRIDNVTPELALVDPTLATLARARLPAPGDCLVGRRRPVVGITTAVSPVAPDGCQAEFERLPPDSRWRARERVFVVSAWLVAIAIVGSSLLAFIPPRGSSRPRILNDEVAVSGVDGPAVPAQSATVRQTGRSQVKASDRAGAVARADGRISIRWPADRRAAFYNVILFRNGTRIDLWPTSNSATYVAPRASWVARGPKGIRYRWYVFPGYRSGKAVDFGPMLGHGVVIAT